MVRSSRQAPAEEPSRLCRGLVCQVCRSCPRPHGSGRRTKSRPVLHSSHTKRRCRRRGHRPIVYRDRAFPFRRRRGAAVVTAPARTGRIRLPARRFSWPLALLIASVGVTAVAAFNAQRAVWSHQRTASRLLKDYAEFTAWTSQRKIETALDGAVMASLQYIMHGSALHQRE